MNKKFIKQPLNGITVADSAVGTRTPNILMGEHAGEYVRGDIMDANAVILAFDELKGDVDTNHDTLEELVNEIHANTDGINEEKTRALNKEKEISDKLAIVDGDSNTEGSFRKAIADVIAAAPEDLDTLKEIADKLSGNDDLHTALNQAIAEKADASDVLLKKSASGGYYIEENSNELGKGAFAANSYCTASGTRAHAEGASTTASGYNSHAEGVNTTASGGDSHAEGENTTASGNYGSHAEGNNTKASGYNSHAEGNNTKASGNYGSHAEGEVTTASGDASHAEGNNTKASGKYSHAEGKNTTASGQSSHAEGDGTKASGYASHAEGVNTTASGYCSHALGTNNVDNKNAIYSVGIGNTTTRKNAEYIYAKNSEDGFSLTDDPKNGYKYLIGVGGYDGISTDNTTYKSVQEVIADLTARIEQLETKVRALEAANTPA